MSIVLTPNAPTTIVPVVTPPLLTATEFFRLHGDQRAELVKGIVRELPMSSFIHGHTCAEIAASLCEVVNRDDLGWVVSCNTSVRIKQNPDTVYGPDVCYVSYERLPKTSVPDGMLGVIPDLVVEVRSPSDSWSAVFAKVADYLSAGVRAVMVLDADTRTASVYRPDAIQIIFTSEQELTLPDVLPNLSTPVARLFADDGEAPTEERGGLATWSEICLTLLPELGTLKTPIFGEVYHAELVTSNTA